MQARFGIRLDRHQKLRLADYHNGTGDFHFHSQIEICYVTEGEIDALVNDHLKRLKKGELSIALAYDTHRYLPVCDAYFSVLIIPPDICFEFETMLGGKTVANPFITGGEAAERIGACIAEIRENKKNQSAALLTKGNLYTILGIIAQNVAFEDGAAASGGSDLVSKILLYIHGHYKEDISLSSIAAHFGYNKDYLARIFRTRYGVTVKKYVNDQKLTMAKRLLVTTDVSVQKIGESVGLPETELFEKYFKYHEKVTPQRFRKMHR